MLSTNIAAWTSKGFNVWPVYFGVVVVAVVAVAVEVAVAVAVQSTVVFAALVTACHQPCWNFT